MKDRKHRELDRWLAAEAAQDDVRAEGALAAVFAWVPRLAPPAGFVDRVMAAAPVAARRAAPAVWAWRWAVAASLALTGLATWLLPALRWAPLRLPTTGEAFKAVASVTVAIAEWFATGLAVWSYLQRIGGLVLVTIQAPEVAAGLAGSAVVSAAALYALNHLLTPERRHLR